MKERVVVAAGLLVVLTGCPPSYRRRYIAPAAVPSSRGVHVHIGPVSEEVVLQRRLEPYDDLWWTVCDAPCDRLVRVDGGADFRATASGSRPTPSFSLDEFDAVTIQVDTASVASQIAGGVVAGVAGAGGLVGAVLFYAGLGFALKLDARAEPAMIGGGVTLAVSAALGVGVALPLLFLDGSEATIREAGAVLDSNGVGVRF